MNKEELYKCLPQSNIKVLSLFMACVSRDIPLWRRLWVRFKYRKYFRSIHK